MICIVEGCSTSHRSKYTNRRFKGVHPVVGVRLFRIPADRREKWCKVINYSPPANVSWDCVRVCSRHFSMKQFYGDKIARYSKTDKLGLKILLPNSVPDRCLPGQENNEDEDDVFDQKEYNRRREALMRNQEKNGSGTSVDKTKNLGKALDTTMPQSNADKNNVANVSVKIEPEDIEPTLPDVLACFEVKREEDEVPNEPAAPPIVLVIPEIEPAAPQNEPVVPQNEPAAPPIIGPVVPKIEPAAPPNETAAPQNEPVVPHIEAAVPASSKSRENPLAAIALGNGTQQNIGSIPVVNVTPTPSEERPKNPSYDCLLSVGFHPSASYNGLCKKIYGANVPNYAQRNTNYYQRYTCEVVSRQFLMDINSYLNKKTTEINSLKKQLKEEAHKLTLMEAEVNQLKFELQSKACDLERLKTALDKSLTKTQQDRILWNKYIPWTEEETSTALGLLYTSGKAYSIIKNALKTPLPPASDLQKVLAPVYLKPGILEGVINLMAYAGKVLEPIDKVCVLSWGKVPVASQLAVSRSDHVVGPLDYMLVAQVSGLFSSWTQPVYYDFKPSFGCKELKEILTALHKADFMVVAVTCELGKENQLLVNELGVSADYPYMSHPATQESVYVVPDAAYSTRVLRKRLLSEEIDLNLGDEEQRGKHVASRYALDELVNSPLNLFTQSQVESEMFSLSVAEALRCQGESRDEEQKRAFEATAKVCEAGALFQDMMGVSQDLKAACENSTDIPVEKLPFGQMLTEQCEKLRHITATLRNWPNMLVDSSPDRHNMVASQTAIVFVCKALPQLFERLKQKFPEEDIKIMTSRFSLVNLRKICGLLSTLFGSYNRPDPAQAEARLQTLILCNNFGSPSQKSNAAAIKKALEDLDINIPSFTMVNEFLSLIELDGPGSVSSPASDFDRLLKITVDEVAVYRKHISGDKTAEDIPEDEDADWAELTDAEVLCDKEVSESKKLKAAKANWTPPDSDEDPHYERGLHHLAEEISASLSTLFPEIRGKIRERARKKRPDWVDFGRLQFEKAPASQILMKIVKKLDMHFREMNKNYISMEPDQTKAFVEKVKEKHRSIPAKIAKLYFAKRRQVRVIQINREFFQNEAETSKRPANQTEDVPQDRPSKRRRICKKNCDQSS